MNGKLTKTKYVNTFNDVCVAESTVSSSTDNIQLLKYEIPETQKTKSFFPKARNSIETN